MSIDKSVVYEYSLQDRIYLRDTQLYIKVLMESTIAYVKFRTDIVVRTTIAKYIFI